MKSIIRDNQSLFVRFGFFQKSRKNPKLSHHVNCSNLSLWHFNPTSCIFKLFSGPWDDINLLSLQVNCVIILWTQNCNEFYDVNLAKTSVTRFARLASAIRLPDNSPAVIQAVTAAMTTPSCYLQLNSTVIWSSLFVNCGQLASKLLIYSRCVPRVSDPHSFVIYFNLLNIKWLWISIYGWFVRKGQEAARLESYFLTLYDR